MQDQDNSQMQSQSGVSFPSVSQVPKKNNSAKTLLIAGILILVGILGFVIFKSASSGSDTITIEPTPSDSLTTPITDETPVASSTPSPTASASAVSKSSVAIEIQNGTGIPGEAAYLQTQLSSLGYSKISVGNASSQNETTTTVTFAKALSADVVDEITKKLQSIYTEVSVKTSTTQSQDVLVVTGTRKGATNKPAATKTPSASGTPAATGSKTPTPTPSKSPSPTPAT